jgi:hypothetical protein
MVVAAEEACHYNVSLLHTAAIILLLSKQAGYVLKTVCKLPYTNTTAGTKVGAPSIRMGRLAYNALLVK